MSVQSITPSLWFDGNAKEAVDFYLSVFPDSRVLATAYYPKTADDGLADFQADRAGDVLAIDFVLDGVGFTAINAGPEFTFNESVSFAVGCRDQAQIDFYWERLSHVPEAEQCGWCKDRYGLSWQVVPDDMATLMQRPQAYAHMMRMKKLVIADL